MARATKKTAAEMTISKDCVIAAKPCRIPDVRRGLKKRSATCQQPVQGAYPQRVTRLLKLVTQPTPVAHGTDIQRVIL